MRVAYVTQAPFISGAERSLQVLIKWISSVGVKPVVICPGSSPFLDWCRNHDIEHEACALELPSKIRPWRWWGNIRTLFDIFRRRQVDILHSNQLWAYPAAARAAAIKRIPRVVHIRDEVSIDGLRWWLKPGAERVVCISRHIARQFMECSSEALHDKIRMLLNPVEIPASRTEEERRRLQLKSQDTFGLQEFIPTFGFIGQIVPVKNLMFLIDILAELQDMEWQLLVAGRDPRPGAEYEKACREKVASHNLQERIKFVGFVENSSRFYEAVDVAVVPSIVEPLGRVPLEAAANYTPTIAFSVGGLPETIRQGRSGWLVGANDREAFRQILTKSTREVHSDMHSAARRWAESIACPKQYVGALRKVYSECCDEFASLRRLAHSQRKGVAP